MNSISVGFYLNHSNQPNIIHKMHFVKGVAQLLIPVSFRDIKKGEELTENYFTLGKDIDVYAQFPFEKWSVAFPGIDFASGGRQEQQLQAFDSLPIGFAAACLMIYVILAWLFGSYLQPLIVMLGIPFALIGVIWGHYIAGINISQNKVCPPYPDCVEEFLGEQDIGGCP